MKTILRPICVLALLSGIAEAAPEYTMFKPYKDRPVTYYRHPLPPVCRVVEPEPRNITTELALKRRAALWRRGMAIAQAEQVFYPSSAPRVTGRVSAQPPPPPAVFFAPAPEPMPPGAPMEAAPPMMSPGGMLPPFPVKPPETAQEMPTAQAVEGRPGFFISPWDPVTGYVDARGVASGTEMRDPYTGRPFRIP